MCVEVSVCFKGFDGRVPAKGEYRNYAVVDGTVWDRIVIGVGEGMYVRGYRVG